jgi:hypothetical protein
VDAGGAPATALLVTQPCLGATLASTLGIPDTDVFAVTVAPGSTLYYSLGTTSSDVELALLDATGQTVGPTIRTGDVGALGTATGGTYYMSASSRSAVNVPYLIGTLVSVDDGGSPCRPYCA